MSHLALSYESPASREAGADRDALRAAQIADGDLEEDSKPRHECGVFGVFSQQKNASRVAFFALYALNHRGQESAGIASFDVTGMYVHKGMGLVSQVFTENDIDMLRGSIAIGHTRYSTAGGSKLVAAQPFVLETDLGQLAIAHNGQVARAAELRKLVLNRGVGLFTNSDSEVIAQMLARPHDVALAQTLLKEDRRRKSSVDETNLAAMSPPGSAPSSGGSPSEAAVAAATGVLPPRDPLWPAWVARISAFMRDCEGAYSFVALTKDALYGVRDPIGLRPLCIGQKKEADGTLSYHLSSESCALATIGSDFVREVRPGEIVRLDKDGISSFHPFEEQHVLAASGALIRMPPTRPSAFCVFEYVYFARPDSILEGQMVHNVRTRLGRVLAREAPAPSADIVSGVPDSSIAAAIGYSTFSGLPFTEVFCKNRYIARTFIKPDDTLRKNAIQLKYNPLSHVLAGKSVVLVDDSLVRGNTLAQLVPLLRRGGAREVHIRISSPPIRHPCYYGVDIGSYEELVAHHLNDVEAIRKAIGADSLAYLSHDGMLEAVNEGLDLRTAYGSTAAAAAAKKDNAGHCSACFSGEYPIKHDKMF